MQRVKCDVVIRLDDVTGKIVLHAIPSGQLDALCHHAYTGWVGSVDQLREMGCDSAEQFLGQRALRELDRHSQSGLGLRDYGALEREELRAAIAALETKARAGDSAAQFEAFRALWNQALKQRSLELLSRAEEYLSAAALQNHQPAVALSATWPKLRAEAEASIAKSAS